MKLTRLHVKDFQQLRAIDERYERPGTVYWGANEAGKSSLCDAIRMALLAESGRVEHKKDWKALVRLGAERGVIEAEGLTGSAEEWKVKVSLPSAAKKPEGPVPANTWALEVVLDPARFAAETADARRVHLFELMKIDASTNEVVRRLVARGCDAGRVKAVTPMMNASGVAAAHELAKEKTSEARAAWKMTTGEAYGSEKAAEWVPSVPAPPEGNTPNAIAVGIAAAEAEVSEFDRAIGELEAKRVMSDSYAGQLNGLKQKAALRERAQIAHDTAAKDLHNMQARIAETERGIEAATKEHPEPCPSCGTMLTHRAGKFHEFKGEIVEKPADAGRLAEWRDSESMLRRAVTNHKRDLDEAVQAAATLTEMEKNVPEAVTQAAIDDVRKELDAVRAKLTVLRTAQQAWEAYDRALKTADEKREGATKHHKDLQAWNAIAEALEPGGIPGEILAEGLEPFNACLAKSSRETGWKPVRVRDDMQIMVGDLPYGLQSASSKFRADVMLAEAVAFLSELDFLVIDGADILEPDARVSLVQWIGELLYTQTLEQAFVLLTMPKAPRGLPDEFDVREIKGGAVAVEAREVAA